MRRPTLLLPAVFALALAGCGQPVPADKAAYVGAWQAPEMVVLITGEGRVAYKRRVANGTKSINAPLQSFQGDNFVVGVGPIRTTFVVSAPPHQDHGAWKMTVDGVELTRQ